MALLMAAGAPVSPRVWYVIYVSNTNVLLLDKLPAHSGAVLEAAPQRASVQ